jgi:hypothetical protein
MFLASAIYPNKNDIKMKRTVEHWWNYIDRRNTKY